MKAILHLIISATLVASGYSQTRNVLVGTNNAVVQPTNFWSADASNARVGLGLGTAATSSISSFQSSSMALSNLATSNGAALTNIQASSIVGIVSLSSNISGTAPLASNVSGVVSIANGGTGATNVASARSALGGTTIGTNLFTLQNTDSVKYLRINASNTISVLSDVEFRSSIGLGSAATNSSSAFQPSSFVLSNLSINDASSLTNISASGISGIVSILNGGTGATNSSGARVNLGLGSAATNPASAFQPSSATLSNLASSNGASLTNISVTNVVGALATNGNGVGLTNLTAANIAGTVARASNVTGTIAISNGGSGATTAGGARTNFGLGATNNVAFGSVAISGGDLQFSNDSIYWAGSVKYSPEDQLFFGAITIEDGAVNFGGTNIAANKAATRANLGLGNISTNTFQTTNTAVYINTNIVATNGKLITTNIESSYIEAYNFFVVDGTNGITFETTNIAAISRTNFGLPWSGLTNTNASTFRSALELGTTNTLTIAGITAQNLTITAGGGIALQSTLTNAASFRTNIGLPLAALTNTNNTNFLAAFFGANTNPVLVNTNGEVVSPTNFWQAAPISTTVQYQTNVTATATNAATNSRNLFLFSMAPSVSGITNTVTLPTNTATTFEGDRATIIHLATNSGNTVTAIRQLGAATNLITLNQSDEAVLLMYRSGAWGLSDNISYIEPIYFSGTNAAANAAASRTNLGLGATNQVQFGSVFINGVFNTLSNAVEIYQPLWIGDRDSTNAVFEFETTSDASIARTNLGLGLPALTNTSNTTFQQAIFTTNAAPTNAGTFGDHVAWMGVSIVTNGVTNTFKIPLYK